MLDQQSDGKVNTCNTPDNTRDNAIGSLNRILRKEMDLEQLNCFLEKTLNPIQLKVIKLRFGLQEDHCYTVDEVCKELNETYDHVRQIEATVLHRIKDPDGMATMARHRKLRDYLD